MSTRRGRDRMERCVSCGRAVPRNKAVEFTRRTHYTTDLKADNVTYTGFVDKDMYAVFILYMNN
jgi:ribosomal protein S26